MAKNINISELDFEAIKSSIKDYMKSDETFRDYNFEGSALDTLTDILGYNTYYNSFYLNMMANEMFLDTARIRDNVVSKAKLLGYTPTSTRSAKATLSSVFMIENRIGDKSNTKFANIKIDSNFVFKLSVDGVDYRFVPSVSRVVNRSQDPIDIGNGQFRHIYEIFDLEVIQGSLVTESYIVDTSDVNQRFLISNPNVDTSTLKVFVKENKFSDFIEEYTLNTDTMALTDVSTRYFLQESADGNYEVLFGDGVLGKNLVSGNELTIRYVTSAGAAVNGLTGQMTMLGKDVPDNIRAATPTVFPNNLSIIGRTYGGSDKESIESIKFYAPRTFEGQNRAVTSRDYMTIIPKIYPQTASMNVWGGEDNDPPQYGRIFISIKPNSGLYLSEQEKVSVKNSLVKNYSVLGLTPDIVDPDFIKLKINTQVKYDNESTLLETADLTAAVKNSIIDYNSKFLNDFNSYFRYSQFLAKIDQTDESITNNLTTIIMINEQSATVNTSSKYSFNFSNNISPNSIYSNAFYISGNELPFYIDDNGLGSIRMYNINNFGTRIYTLNAIGTVNYTTGLVDIPDLNVTGVLGGDMIGIACTPASNDIFPVRNQIIYIDMDELEVNLIEDTDEFNENYDISTQRVVVSRNVSTSYNTNSASISSGSSGSITRVYGDSSQTSAGSSGSSSSSGSGY